MIKPHPIWDKDATWATFENGKYRDFVQGIEIQKSTFDLKRYRDAVAESGAELIIETGTRTGGSAIWFHYELGVEVISVDIAPQFVAAVGPPHRGAGITFIVGGSTRPDAIAEVQARSAGKRIMVSLDSDHHAPHVLEEIRLYGPLVSPGCHLVVEDGCFDLFGDPNGRRGGENIPEIGGPLLAVDQAGLEHDGDWERATDIEGQHQVSHSPAGWWRRVR